EEGEVRGIDVAFEGLHVVGVAHDLRDRALRGGGDHIRFDVREGRRYFTGAHVGPDDAVALDAGIGGCLDLGPEVAFGRLRRHVDALPRDIELPAVVNAAQAFFFIAAEEQRRTAVGAGVL